MLALGAGTSNGPAPHYSQSAVPTGLSNVIAVAGGAYHSLALKSDGSVVAWGWNSSGQTNVPAFLSNVLAIAAGGSNSLALKSDGTVVAWGDNTYGQTLIPTGLSNVVSISGGAAHCVALKSDGSLAAWGLSTDGQADVSNGLTNIMATSAGAFHNLALFNIGPVAFLRHPKNQTVFSGSPSSMDVAALGAQPLTYQWQFNNTNLPNATNAILAFSNTPLAASGDYRCIVSNALSTATSSKAKLTVFRSTPQFIAGGSGIDAYGNFTLALSGLSGHGSSILLASTNLLDWESVFTNEPVLGTLFLTDSNRSYFPQRFYRFREE